MNRITLIIYFFCFFLGQAISQPPSNRYTSNLFSNYSETTNVTFSTSVPQPNPGGGFYESVTGYPLNVDEFSTSPVTLKMNIFQPTGDTLTKRPVIIICFGGGFVTGSKDYWSIRLLAQSLAKRGFVTAVIDYRLGMNMFDADLSKRAVYRGVQDGRSAVRFFKADAAGSNTYKIDPNQIYIGGHSAGAFIATHNAYLDKESERPESTYVWPQGCGTFDWSTCWCPDQGCLDCVGNNQSFSGHAKAVFSLAGAIDSTKHLETASDPKIVMFHSQDDDTVPYDSGEPFGSLTPLIIGSDLPMVYGSLPMSTRANNIGLPNQFNSYTNRGHSVHEATSSTLHADIVPGISDWFFLQLLKPVTHTISGKTKVCNSDLTQSYSVQPSLANYYQWQITGGSFVNMQTSSNQVTVLWNATAPVKTLSMTPYSIHDAKGDLTSVNITTANTFTNNWSSLTEDWSLPTNWSLSILPDVCHEVVIPNQINPIVVTIPQNKQYKIKSLTVGNKATLKLVNPTQLTVED